jgi:hypothetical protein
LPKSQAPLLPGRDSKRNAHLRAEIFIFIAIFCREICSQRTDLNRPCLTFRLIKDKEERVVKGGGGIGARAGIDLHYEKLVESIKSTNRSTNKKKSVIDMCVKAALAGCAVPSFPVVDAARILVVTWRRSLRKVALTPPVDLKRKRTGVAEAGPAQYFPRDICLPPPVP